MEHTTLDPRERFNLLRDDLTDVAVWLKAKYSTENFVLIVDFFHRQSFSKEIAYVVIIGPEQEERRAIRTAASQSLEALGWLIDPEGGGDIIDAQPNPTSDLSAHQRLRAIGRVKNALDQVMRSS